MLSRSFARGARAGASPAFTSCTRPASSISRSVVSQCSTKTTSAQTCASTMLSRRHYSDTAQTPTEKQPEATAQAKDGESATNSETETLKKDLEAKGKEAVDFKDKFLRSVADFRNLQERTKREVQTSRDFALQKFAKDLLASVDNLDHALRAVPKDRVTNAPADEGAKEIHKDLVNLHSGLEMVESVLLNTLKRHGVTRFDPALEADAFDPNLHEAVFMAPQPDKKDNTVFHTQQKGFMLNGRVLRAAQVGVVKNS